MLVRYSLQIGDLFLLGQDLLRCFIENRFYLIPSLAIRSDYSLRGIYRILTLIWRRRMGSRKYSLCRSPCKNHKISQEVPWGKTQPFVSFWDSSVALWCGQERVKNLFWQVSGQFHGAPITTSELIDRAMQWTGNSSSNHHLTYITNSRLLVNLGLQVLKDGAVNHFPFICVWSVVTVWELWCDVGFVERSDRG